MPITRAPNRVWLSYAWLGRTARRVERQPAYGARWRRPAGSSIDRFRNPRGFGARRLRDHDLERAVGVARRAARLLTCDDLRRDNNARGDLCGEFRVWVAIHC